MRRNKNNVALKILDRLQQDHTNRNFLSELFKAFTDALIGGFLGAGVFIAAVTVGHGVIMAAFLAGWIVYSAARWHAAVNGR